MNRSHLLPLLFIANLVLMVFTAFSFWFASESIARRSDEEKALRESQKLISEIASLKQSLPDSRKSLEESVDLMPVVLEGIKQSGLSESQVASLQRNQPVPISKSKYAREETQLSLRNMTLEQGYRLAKFLEQTQNETVCSIVDMQPVSASQSDDAVLWNIQLTLTRITQVETSLRVKK